VGNLLIAAGTVHVVAARTGEFYGQQMLAGHIYAIPMGGYGGTDVRADPPATWSRSARNDLCNGNCGDTPGTVRVSPKKTGHLLRHADAGRAHLHGGWRNEFAAVAAPGNGGPAASAAPAPQ